MPYTMSIETTADSVRFRVRKDSACVHDMHVVKDPEWSAKDYEDVLARASLDALQRMNITSCPSVIAYILEGIRDGHTISMKHGIITIESSG